MTTINASAIADLRARTGAGLSDCKKALIEAEGDMNKAIELLRQKGIASAANKSGRLAAEGATATFVNEHNSVGVMFELNSQTDFVAKNEKFLDLIKTIGQIALKNSPKSLEALKACKAPSGESIDELVQLKTAEIGEKLDLRRYILQEANNESCKVYCYTHPIGSKISVLLTLQAQNESIAKDMAMHIAAVQPMPEYLDRSEIPATVIEQEKRIEAGKSDLAGKPPEIVDKIVTGRVDKILAERVLLEQGFIKEPSKKIKDYLTESKAELFCFARFNLGEGLEKKNEDFAEEVAAVSRV